jgi:cobalt-zinc-cadmium efflux system membrane fusion protein
VADVPEQSAGHLKAGESVVVEIPALPDRLVEGRLSFVSPTVNPETRTVRARLDLDNAERLYRPAMLASVIIKGKLEKKLTLPRDAVVREENRDYVFVPVQGGFRMQPVTLGADYDGKREVTGGLRADDRVVVRGAFHLNNERKRRLQGGA